MLEAHAQATSLCAGCPKMCRHACPVSNAEARETVTPGNKMAVLDLVRLGRLPLDEDTSALFNACTGCGACSEFCLLGNDVASALIHARGAATAARVNPVAEQVSRRHERSGNPTGEDLAALQRERLPARPEQGALVYFPGCTALRRLPDHASDTLTALERVTGSTVAVAPVGEDAACCGYPLWAAGLTQAFVQNARRMAAHLAGRGTIVTSDPGCAYTLRNLYAAVGVTPELTVRHVSQVLAAGNVQQVERPDEPSLYHDPCYLGRHGGIYDEPRAVIARAEGRAPVEFTWNREKAECCGGGALYPHAEPQAAERIARRRVHHETDELRRTGAARVVTACPTCELQLGRAGVPVADISRVVLGKTAPAPRQERTRQSR
ncbi:MAG: (Fe-S)-binding protein [Myxococcota bacterium]